MKLSTTAALPDAVKITEKKKKLIHLCFFLLVYRTNVCHLFQFNFNLVNSCFCFLFFCTLFALVLSLCRCSCWFCSDTVCYFRPLCWLL